MHRRLYERTLAIILIAFSLSSCSNEQTIGTTYTTESGLSYVFLHDEEGDPVKEGNIIEFDALQSVGNGVLVNTFDKPNYFEREIVGSPKFEGDFMEAIRFLSVGDSAELSIPLSKLPEQLIAGLGTNNPDDETLFKMIIVIRGSWNEKAVIDEFVNQLGGEDQWKTLTNGVRIKWDSLANGRKVEFGDSVFLHTKGLFLSGIAFTPNSLKPLGFEAGDGSIVPKALETAAFEMSEGDKVTIITPYSMAYGSRLHPPILKYSTLVYELDLIRLVKSTQ